MYRLIDSYPSKPMKAEKVGQCQICGEGAELKKDRRQKMPEGKKEKRIKNHV